MDAKTIPSAARPLRNTDCHALHEYIRIMAIMKFKH
jgi:hypothetical protein